MTTKHQVLRKNQTLNKSSNFYSALDQLNGLHPWMDKVPEGYVPYKVRELGKGQIAYFNFVLAKEMGLIPQDHPHTLNPQLVDKLISTFSIQIINEYDELSKKRLDPQTIKPNAYMATRYLQLQHSNKQGKTSGDGRGIWNGVVQHKGITWDVSSRGTGVTSLAPGAVQANRPLKTGGTEFGYGCGLAEIDELVGASILAEIMHLQGYETERMLCVIDHGNGYGIGVRAAQNLIRPAHLFLYLKQERYYDLKSSVDYLIERQVNNKKWNINLRSPQKYDQLLKEISFAFAKFSARLEMDYVFAWLDWDGDNVLADAGIIDYGSVRQFGIRHDKYRYDDVERFSTNLNEQKGKARLIVQVFAQAVDYLKTKDKKPLKNFAKHSVLNEFDHHFERERVQRLLYRAGFNQEQRQILTQKHRRLVASFDKEYSWFEKAKVSGHQEKVADGVNHPALFNMRTALTILPQIILNDISTRDFFSKIKSGFAKSRDQKMSETQSQHLTKLFNSYRALAKACLSVDTKQNTLHREIAAIKERSERLNTDHRITGNALIEIVDEVLTERRKGLPFDQIQKIVDRFVLEHRGLPEVELSRFYRQPLPTPVVQPDLMARLLNLISVHKEDI